MSGEIRRAVIEKIETYEAARAARQPEAEPVAWIEFADNGNIRFWTSDQACAWTEGDNGRPLRKFTLAELVALAASPRLDREKVALLIMNVRRRKYGLDDLDLNTLKKIKSDDGIVEAFAIADAILREAR